MEADKLIKIIGELFVPQLLFFNLCFVYIGMLLAPTYSIYTAVLVTIAFVSARSSGVLMNRYVGRAEDMSDANKLKSMLSLRIPKRTVLALFAVCAAIFLCSAYLLNSLALILAPIPLAFFVIDPMVKRHTSSRHYFLGVIQSFDVMGGYIGAAGTFPVILQVYVLMFAVLFIGAGFDILISMRKAAFDARKKIKTIASTKGIPSALNYSLYSHVSASIFLVAFALVSGSIVIVAGSLIASAFLIAQHVNIDPKDVPDVMRRVAIYNTVAAMLMLLCVLISASSVV